MSEDVLNKSAGILERRVLLAVGMAAGIAAGAPASVALAQTGYVQGYGAYVTWDDPGLGPVSDSSSLRSFFVSPPSFHTHGSASASRTVSLPDGTEFYLGGGGSNGQGQAGDRFLKAKTDSVLDFATGSTNASALATWSSSATPGGNALADISVLFDRSLHFADFLSNTDRGNQILDFANASFPGFSQAEALTLEAGVSLNVQITERETGVYWYSYLQEEVNRKFLFLNDNGNPIIIGGTGDQSYSIFRTGTNISGLDTETQSISGNTLSFSVNYPPRYGINFSSIFGIDNVFLHSGRTYDISLSLACYSSVSALSGLAGASRYEAGCDAGNSAYWLGLNNFRDFAGNPIAPGSFTSTDTGFDLAQRSPSTPGGGAMVPEPATWALMIGGFGLAGAAIRRRRTALAA